MAGGNLEKRIKRHVRGTEQRIAAIFHPALGDLVAAELAALGYRPETEDPGVLTFPGRIADLYRLHARCRIPASFRVRLLEFRCGSREDLFRHMRSFPWEYWLRPGSRVSLRLSTRETRLQHDGRAGRSAWKAVAGRMDEAFGAGALSERPASGTGAAAAGKILVQVVGTRARVSLDTTGDLLYRRGWGRKQGKAPLRENLAAAILAAAPFDLSAGGSGMLVDGMAGSGTLLGEAILSRYGLAPVPDRLFAFQDWPVYSAAAWEHELRQAREENCRCLESGPPSGEDGGGSSGGAGRDRAVSHIAVEIDPAVREYLADNLGRFALMYACPGDAGGPAVAEGEPRRFPLSPKVSIEAWCEDLFVWAYQIISRERGGQRPPSAPEEIPGTLLLNPPYDWRIADGRKTYSRIWNLLDQLLPEWQAVVLIPLDAGRRPALGAGEAIPGSLAARSGHRDFPHGGRWIRALYVNPADR
jgi:putative N6-adenine-specific DNA methylase